MLGGNKKLSMRRLNRILTMLLSEMKDLTDEGRDLPIRWNIMHMYSSSQLAKLLAIHRGIDPELAGIAAALHDIGVVMTQKHEGHAEVAPQYVYDFLEKYNRESEGRLPKVIKEEMDTLVNAILQHSEKEIYSDDPVWSTKMASLSRSRLLRGRERLSCRDPMGPIPNILFLMQRPKPPPSISPIKGLS